MAQTHSTDALHASHGTPVSNVQEDKIDLRAIFGFAFGLAIVIVVVEIAMVVWFRMGVSAIDASNPPRCFRWPRCPTTGGHPNPGCRSMDSRGRT